jgi:hypothetical protein
MKIDEMDRLNFMTGFIAGARESGEKLVISKPGMLDDLEKWLFEVRQYRQDAADFMSAK